MCKLIKTLNKEWKNIGKEIQSNFPEKDIFIGAVYYRDPIDDPKTKNELIDLSSSIEYFQSFSEKINVQGGKDGPHDWAGGFSMAIHKISWRNGQKLIIHICDSPGHGYCEGKHKDQKQFLDKAIDECVEYNINVFGIMVGNNPQLSECFDQFKTRYDSKGGKSYLYDKFDLSKDEKTMSQNLTKIMMKAVYSE